MKKKNLKGALVVKFHNTFICTELHTIPNSWALFCKFSIYRFDLVDCALGKLPSLRANCKQTFKSASLFFNHILLQCFALVWTAFLVQWHQNCGFPATSAGHCSRWCALGRQLWGQQEPQFLKPFLNVTVVKFNSYKTFFYKTWGSNQAKWLKNFTYRICPVKLSLKIERGSELRETIAAILVCKCSTKFFNIPQSENVSCLQLVTCHCRSMALVSCF